MYELLSSDNSTSQEIIILPFWTCFFIDSVSKDGNYPIIDSNLTLRCKPEVKYLSEDHGLKIITVISSFIWLIGSLGIITNVLNILVLRKSQAWSSESFKFLLIVLACFEFSACFFAIPLTGISLIIMNCVNRDKALLYVFILNYLFYCIARSGAVIMTVLITLERYMAVAFPLQTKNWLTSPKTKFLYAVIAFVSAIAINFAWIMSVEVDENIYIGREENMRLDKFPFIFTGTFIERYATARKFRLIVDYVAPFPILLTLNGLLYFKIHSWNKNRKALSNTQRKEISAAKMFSVVMLILLLCHTVACFVIFVVIKYSVLYRELMFLQYLMVTISASVNILVYLGGKQFREELRKQVGFMWDRVAPSVTQTETSHASRFS